MIIDFFIKMFNKLIALLPDFSSIDFTGGYSLNPFFNALNVANYYIPVTEIFVLIEIVLGFFTARLCFGIIKWLASRIVV